MNIAYLRVSTSRQHLDNQKDEIKRFAVKRGIKIDMWYNDIISGKTLSRERKLGDILTNMKEGDALIVTEVSRLSRTLIDIMNIINSCVERKIVLHCTKEGYTFEDNINSKILGFAFGLVAEIERNLISMRTKEALAARRACGIKLGRPIGSSPKLNILVKDKDMVRQMINANVCYRDIANKYSVSICTVNRFVRWDLGK